ncbi:hypothetical protein FVO59_03055 [Microbacterium esteraromaticum]|uniref:Uncharacterized protein n=1 Tax=Microbacterium esteraromaticum TaxID=57043 RepID=A0A7D7WBM8_9MICO|nr:hypothetical protein [Microbacterium esteraromaticum]QMU96299.1 hypothetical protein FVO59_03055 [Microbacterium esteraromaticum]
MSITERFPNSDAAKAARVGAGVYERTVIALLGSLPTSALDSRVLRGAGLAIRHLDADAIGFRPVGPGPDLSLTVHRLDRLGAASTLAAVAKRQRREAADLGSTRDWLATTRLRGLDSREQRDAGADYLRDALDLFRALILLYSDVTPALKAFGDAVGFDVVGDGFAVLDPDGIQIGAPFGVSELGAQYSPESLRSRIASNVAAFHTFRNEIIDLIAEALIAPADGHESDGTLRAAASLPTLPRSVQRRVAQRLAADEDTEDLHRKAARRHHGRALGQPAVRRDVARRYELAQLANGGSWFDTPDQDGDDFSL